MKITYCGKDFSTFVDFWREFCYQEDTQTIREIRALIGTRPVTSTTYCDGAVVLPRSETQKESK